MPISYVYLVFLAADLSHNKVCYNLREILTDRPSHVLHFLMDVIL